eukprot:5521465-Prymnesium_polylepis.1
MRTEAHKSVGSAPNCRGMTNRCDTSAHTRANGDFGRTVPSAEGTLESSPAAVSCEECQTSTRDQVEKPD